MLASRRARLAVLTNKPLRLRRSEFSTRSGLRPVFDAVIGGDGPYGRKPNPAALARADCAATSPAC